MILSVFHVVLRGYVIKPIGCSSLKYSVRTYFQRFFKDAAIKYLILNSLQSLSVTNLYLSRPSSNLMFSSL
jgi:hypothetical protein